MQRLHSIQKQFQNEKALVFFFKSITQMQVARKSIASPEENKTYELVQMCLFIGKL